MDEEDGEWHGWVMGPRVNGSCAKAVYVHRVLDLR